MSTQKAKFELYAKLQALGFTYEEAVALRRIEMTLQRWAEQECGDEHGRAIERDEVTGKPFMTYDKGNNGERGRYAIADREAGALKRLKAIVDARNKREQFTGSFSPHAIIPYHQSDPRGCALYLVKASELEGNRIVEKAQSLGFTWAKVERPLTRQLGPTIYNSPQLPGRDFAFPEQGAVWFLKAKGESVPESRNLPIDSVYTRGLAVCC